MAESDPSPQSNVLELTVTELSGKLKRTVEDTFGHVRVRGEISGYRGPHSSGHSYFSLKDDRARLEAVIWRGVASKLKHLPEEGLEVIATGKLTTYPGSSKYQIVIENIEPAGAGALMALLEERKKKLAAEGLFDDGRKQLIPYMPRVIGVVTSPTGAVIRDVLHRLADRFPLHVLVWPVRVQGETSGQEVAEAIRGFNAIDGSQGIPRPDTLIVARGGGSIEDLWGFNDEAVVRAAADSDIPLISAVGHETDWTLIDLAADLRAPTPTGAAEFAVPVKADLEAHLANQVARLRSAISRRLDSERNELRAATRGLSTPDSIFELPRRRLDEASGRMGTGLDLSVRTKRAQFERISGRLSIGGLSHQIDRQAERLASLASRSGSAISNRMERRGDYLRQISSRLTPAPIKRSVEQLGNTLAVLSHRQATAMAALGERRTRRMEQANRLLHTLSYKATLSRGYAVVRNAEGTPLATAGAVRSTTAISIEMHDGMVDARTDGKAPDAFARTDAKAVKPKKPPAEPGKGKGEQGSLF